MHNEHGRQQTKSFPPPLIAGAVRTAGSTRNVVLISEWVVCAAARTRAISRHLYSAELLRAENPP